MTDHHQVVSEEQVTDPVPTLQFQHQVEDLGLHGDVEGGDRLVSHHQPGPCGQSTGDADSLSFPATEGVGIAPGRFGPEPHLQQQLADAIPPVVAGGDSQFLAVNSQGLVDDPL